MSGRGFRPSERITRATLNRALTAPVDLNLSGPRVNERRGQTVITDEEEIYVRVTGSATSPRRYAWQEVYHDKVAGGWKSTNRMGSVDSDPAFELNDAIVPSGLTVYTARRSRASGAWTFNKGGGGGGNVEIKSGETVLMILGTYEQYKDCPDVPGSPPTLETGCGEATTTLCVPAYAYAVYQRCGYVWQKIGDTRDFGVWANELNGGSTAAWRRFVIPRWGGDVDPLTGLPDPDAACMGVAFLGNGGSALTCSCPPCLTTPPEGSCLAIRFRTPPRPCPYDPGNLTCGYGCAGSFFSMDANDLWDKEITIPLELNGCLASGTDETGTFDFEWQFGDGYSLECDWGPDVFDPCNPCSHWGAISASLGIAGGNEPNCGGAGIWRAEYRAADICALLCDCGTGPVRPVFSKPCNGCSNSGGTAFFFAIEETIELICCPEEGTGVGAMVAGGFASGYSVPQAIAVPGAAVHGGFADGSIPDAVQAIANPGGAVAGSSAVGYSVPQAIANPGAAVHGGTASANPTDIFYPDSFEDL